jgi:hypothetical protein
MCTGSLDRFAKMPGNDAWRRRLRGTGFASNRVVGVEGILVMSNEYESPVSNWTLATGTRPGERLITDTETRPLGERPISDTETRPQGERSISDTEARP